MDAARPSDPGSGTASGTYKAQKCRTAVFRQIYKKKKRGGSVPACALKRRKRFRCHDHSAEHVRQTSGKHGRPRRASGSRRFLQPICKRRKASVLCQKLCRSQKERMQKVLKKQKDYIRYAYGKRPCVMHGLFELSGKKLRDVDITVCILAYANADAGPVFA